MEKSPGPHNYLIDIAGTCNLRCPSCPTGNFRKAEFVDTPKPLGFMSLEKFEAILKKIVTERNGALTRIDLFNWGDPLLHPKVPEFIAKVRAYPKFRCAISSNLSMKVDLDAVIAAGPHWFRVSLSGFSPATYSRTHRRGDVDLVKANMRKLREAVDRHAAKTVVEVSYHLYQHNAGEDFEAMLRLCEELRFNFKPVWASFYPLEKVMAYGKGEVSKADSETIALLALKPEELLAAARAHRSEPCRLQENQTAINHDGTVQLCCATYDPALILAPDFLSVSADELMSRKYKHATCNECLAGGYHAMMLYRGVEAADALGNARIGQNGARFRLVGGTVVRDAADKPAARPVAALDD